MRTIVVSKSKKLKLTNVIIKQISDKDFEQMETIIMMFDNYVRNIGAKMVGPIVQYVSQTIDEDGNTKFDIKCMRQVDRYIEHIEEPFDMKSIIQVKKCLYARFTGRETDLKFAYDKLRVSAYEEELKLTGNNYTIFVDGDDDHVVVDIFMEIE